MYIKRKYHLTEENARVLKKSQGIATTTTTTTAQKQISNLKQIMGLNEKEKFKIGKETSLFENIKIL